MYNYYSDKKITKQSKKGFTLAEIMVVLFVLTVILAAFAPMMTTRTKTTATSPVRYASPDTANAYFGIFDGQKFMLGQSTGSNDTINNKLTINRPDTSDLTAAHILFNDNGTAAGQLTMTSDHSVILGGNPSSVYSGAGNTTAVGYGVLPNSTGKNNTGMGYYALNSATTGSYNVAYGVLALNALTTGQFNTGIGYNAANAVTTGSNNVAIGHEACINVSTTSSNTCIGYNAQGASNISNGIFIGNTSSSIAATSIYFGNSTLNNLISSVSSDERLKNIKGENTAGLEKIKQMKTYDYTFKSDEDREQHVGVIAQEVQKFFPEAVFKDNDGYLKIRKERLFFAVVNAIKELAAQTSEKDLKIQELEKKNAELEERLLKLEEKMETLSVSKKFTFRSKLK